MATPRDPKVSEIVERLIRECQREEVNIVVIGERGVGKSTLINGLVGSNVMRTGHGASVGTQGVEEYKMGRLQIFDTPGFFARKSSMSIGDIVQQIATKTEGRIDLLVYCHSMGARITDQTKKGIGCIADSLRSPKKSTTPWKNVLYVLTRANEVEDSITKEELEAAPGGQEEELSVVERVKERFQELYEDISQGLREDTEEIVRERRMGNAAEIADIPIVAAGFKRAALPGYDDWLSNLWKAAFSRADAAAGPAFMDATLLLRLLPEGAGPDQSGTLPSDQKIRNDKIARLKKALTGLSVGVVFIPVGAAVGAAGGAALGAIGGPVGIVGGAVGGATVGVKVGAVVGTIPAAIGTSYAAFQSYMWHIEKRKDD